MRRRRILLGLGSVSMLATGLVVLSGRADTGTYSCTVTAGARISADFRSSGEPAIGGCKLVRLGADSVATSVNPSSGCRIAADPQETGNATVPVAVGTSLPKGTDVYVFCNAGTINAANSLTLQGTEDAHPTPAGWTSPVVVTG